MWYKNIYIDPEFMTPWFSIQWCGDELIFSTIEEAKEFIDEQEKLNAE